MNYRQHIAELLSQALASAGQPKSAEECLQLLEVPKDARMGDYAFPCFVFSKVLKKAPPAIAAEFIATLGPMVEGDEHVASAEAAGPYVNFRINRSALGGWLLPSILEGEFLNRRASRDARVMIEYSQPNTHKPFHVGHTRNVALGDALVRMCDWAGFDVVAANYFGDVGAHIAKCLWVYRQEVADSDEVPTTHRGEFLGRLYSRAVELLDFSLLTRAPHPGVITAKVLAKKPHPENEKWTIVEVDFNKESKQVVCGGIGFDVGDIVPYATVGTRVAGREVTVSEKKGIASEGNASFQYL